MPTDEALEPLAMALLGTTADTVRQGGGFASNSLGGTPIGALGALEDCADLQRVVQACNACCKPSRDPGIELKEPLLDAQKLSGIHREAAQAHAQKQLHAA